MIISKQIRKNYKFELFIFNFIFLFLLLLLIIFIIQWFNDTNSISTSSSSQLKISEIEYKEIPTLFTNRKEYYERWEPLLYLNTFEQLKKSTDTKSIRLNYNLYLNGLINFTTPNKVRLSKNMFQKLLYPSSKKIIEPYIFTLPELQNQLNTIYTNLPEDIFQKEQIEFINSENSTSSERVYQPIAVSPELNMSQKNAIEYALNNNLTLIQGPPGTGKTRTSIEIIKEVTKVNPGSKILLSASSNFAVNQLVLKCKEENIPVLRIFARSALDKIDTSDELYFTSLEYKIKEYAQQNNDIEFYNQILKSEVNPNFIFPDTYYGKLNKVQKLLINNYNCIATTCTKLNHPSLKNLYFDTILIDECAQMLELEALLAINKGSENCRIILVGDPQQLQPSVTSEKAKNLKYSRSLFERLVNGIDMLEHPLFEKQFLNIQYRMYPSIAEFPSIQFYNSKLKNGNNTLYLPQNLEPFWKANTFGYPMLFWNNNGLEEAIIEGGYINKEEGIKIQIIINILEFYNINPKDIGIITPYRAQIKYLNDLINSYRIDENNKIRINTVDSYQGQEEKYIILSTVRSSLLSEDAIISSVEDDRNKSPLGFVKDPKRLNVALTRSKYGLFIVGNASFLSSNDKNWSDLVTFYKKYNCLREIIKVV
jgi:regulator of nonsense transcripts 1